MTLHLHRYSPPRYALQILTENDNHLLEGGTGFTMRYPSMEESFMTDLTGNRYQFNGPRHDGTLFTSFNEPHRRVSRVVEGTLFTSFNEHHSNVLRVSRVVEEMMYGFRGELTPPRCTLLVHCEGEPTRTLRECLLTSMQYGESMDIMSIECNWAFRECDFRGGIPDEGNHADMVDAYFAAFGRDEQPERVNWQREGF